MAAIAEFNEREGLMNGEEYKTLCKKSPRILMMDNSTQWMVRGAFGTVILSTVFIFCMPFMPSSMVTSSCVRFRYLGLLPVQITPASK